MAEAERAITSHRFLSEARRCATSAILDASRGDGRLGTGCDSGLTLWKVWIMTVVTQEFQLPVAVVRSVEKQVVPRRARKPGDVRWNVESVVSRDLGCSCCPTTPTL